MVRLELDKFTEGGVISESVFFEKLRLFDWQPYRGKAVLIKGCETTIVPPWVFMVLTAQLIKIARSIRYGNEHSNILIFNSKSAV
jgi:hypothetical protein